MLRFNKKKFMYIKKMLKLFMTAEADD